MAIVLNRTTKQLITSANTPDYPVTDWIIEPNLSAVAGFASIYWTIVGDTVSLMSPAERAAVDATILSVTRDATAATMDQLENYVRAFALVVLDEVNILRAQHSLAPRTITQLKTAVRNKLGT